MILTRRQLRRIIGEAILQEWDDYDDIGYEDSFNKAEALFELYDQQGLQAFIDELHANPPEYELPEILKDQARIRGYEDILITLEKMGIE